VERFDPSLEELEAATGLNSLDIREVFFRAQEPLSLEGQQVHASKLTLLDSQQLLDGPRPLFVDCRHD
jgi:hypothetical protein